MKNEIVFLVSTFLLLYFLLLTSLTFRYIIGLKGDTEESTVKCTKCKTSMTIKRKTLRVSTLMVSTVVRAEKL